MKETSINEIPLSSMGVTMTAGWRTALLTPAPIKDLVSNDDPEKPGIQVITKMSDGTSAAVIKERDVTLTFIVKGADEEDFLKKYTAFLQMLYKGKIILHVPSLGQHFGLIYRNATKYDDYGNVCTLAVKFTEPDPTDREETEITQA